MNQNTYRIFKAVLISLVGCGFGIYNVVHRNSLDYQVHPAASLFGSIIPGIVFGFASYWWDGWRAKRKEGQLNQSQNSNPPARVIVANAGDDKFYDEVARELQEKQLVAGLWTKAYAEMGGDEAKARALYIKYRVANLKEEQRNAHFKLQSEEEERKKGDKGNRATMKSKLITICKKCGYTGSMKPSPFHYAGEHSLFGTACKCPKCSHRFDWYYIHSKDSEKAPIT